jgi:hypothetical protein
MFFSPRDNVRSAENTKDRVANTDSPQNNADTGPNRD